MCALQHPGRPRRQLTQQRCSTHLLRKVRTVSTEVWNIQLGCCAPLTYFSPGAASSA